MLFDRISPFDAIYNADGALFITDPEQVSPPSLFSDIMDLKGVDI